MTEERKETVDVVEEPKEKEKNWLDRICEWGHAHPVAIALIVLLCPFGLIWLGTLMVSPDVETDTDEQPLCTDGLKPIPVETVETTRYHWVPDDSSEV